MKSNVSDLLELAHAVYIDACAKCPAEVSDLRDLKTMRARVEDEGLSFLTITLPNFAKDLERALSLGRTDPAYFRSFEKYGAIPAFLRGMLGQIFNRETGELLNEENLSIYIGAVRQVCLLFKKVEAACTPERDRAAIDNFVKVEQLNKDFTLPEELQDRFVAVSAVLWHNAMGGLRLDVLVPRHGPGATAEGIRGNSKWLWREWYERLEPFFPFLGNGYAVGSSGSIEFQNVTFVPPERERPVKVTLVPKTLKGPRIIAIEPVCMQYAQQAIRATLYECLESYWLTRGHVNFRDQSINQTLALVSSATGHLATIDLSDASDRVLHALAIRMFDSNPDLRDAIDACRSTGAALPDGRVIRPLYKFASMGSALCFPIEAMYFYTIVVLALLEKHKLSVNSGNVYAVSRNVYVYGDDLVVPTEDAGAVLDYLQKYHCKVNDSKTFLTGKFRESCGVDAFDGESVTPTYLRRMRPKNRQSVTELISWVATANLFYKKGYWHAASLMFRTCEGILGPLPYVSDASSGLGRVSFLGYRSVERWNEQTHRFEIKGWVPSPVYRCDRIDGYSALQLTLTSLERRKTSEQRLDKVLDWEELADVSSSWELIAASVDEKHLERSAVRGALSLKRRWVPST